MFAIETLKKRLELLATLDDQRSIFGASSHDWVLAPPLTEAELARFEARAGVTLPQELRMVLAEVGSSGAGPHYGLLPLPTQGVEVLSEPFVGDAGRDDPRARTPGDRAGCLVLAEQGCGYKSVVVLTGPRRGRVLADMREALDGFHEEAPDVLSWYAQWLERSLAEWARGALPEIVGRRPGDVDDDEAAALDAVAPILERYADPDAPRTPHDAIYPTAHAEHMMGLLLLRTFQGRFVEAQALADRIEGAGGDEPVARAALARARIHGAEGAYVDQLALAEATLLRDDLWYTTRTDLLLAKESALRGLERRADLAATVLERARHTRDLYTYYDAAWAHLTGGDVDGAAAALVEAAQKGIRHPAATGPAPSDPAEAALEDAAELFGALAQDGRVEEATKLRAQLERARERRRS